MFFQVSSESVSEVSKYQVEKADIFETPYSVIDSPEQSTNDRALKQSIFYTIDSKSDLKDLLDEIQADQKKILANQEKITSQNDDRKEMILKTILEKINKLEIERQKDKKIIAQAFLIFQNIENIQKKSASFQSTVLKGIEEIKNALLRIYDFVEK